MLAIAAAKLGFGPVVAVDHEVEAVEATRENARANEVTLDRVERVDLRAEPAPVEAVTVAEPGAAAAAARWPPSCPSSPRR